MIRTFHAKPSYKLLIGCLLPYTILTIYFFWIKLPIAAFIFMMLMVLTVERLIHTSYIVTDENMLIINKGKFSKRKIIPIKDIDNVEITELHGIRLLKHNDNISITLKNKNIIYINPFPANEFQRYLEKKIKEINNNTIITN